MTALAQSEPQDRQEKVRLRKKPILVWIIFFFYLVGFASAILSVIAISSGSVAMSEIQRTYFGGHTVIYSLAIIAIYGGYFAGATALLMMKKVAFPIMVGAFLFLQARLIYDLAFANLTAVVGTAAVIGMVGAALLHFAILAYVRKLAKQNLLV